MGDGEPSTSFSTQLLSRSEATPSKAGHSKHARVNVRLERPVPSRVTVKLKVLVPFRFCRTILIYFCWSKPCDRFAYNPVCLCGYNFEVNTQYQSPSPPTSIPPSPFFPSLISCTVSVDVKHHVYCLQPASTVGTRMIIICQSR